MQLDRKKGLESAVDSSQGVLGHRKKATSPLPAAPRPREGTVFTTGQAAKTDPPHR